jgi:hypothetical protein
VIAAGPGSCNLLRRAGVAFDKLQKVLEACEPPGEGFGTPVGREFVGILSKVLLPNAQYCQRSTVTTFQGKRTFNSHKYCCLFGPRLWSVLCSGYVLATLSAAM